MNIISICIIIDFIATFQIIQSLTYFIKKTVNESITILVSAAIGNTLFYNTNSSNDKKSTIVGRESLVRISLHCTLLKQIQD